MENDQKRVWLENAKQILKSGSFTTETEKLLSWQIFQITNLLENKNFGTREYDKDLFPLMKNTVLTLFNMIHDNMSNSNLRQAINCVYEALYY